jgi:hypothetical protein
MFETPFGPIDEQTKSMQEFRPNFGETIKIIGGHRKPMDESSAWDEKVEVLVSLGYRRAKAQRMADAYYERPANRPQPRLERIGGVVSGLFLMAFGTPFVLAPPWFTWLEMDAGGGFGPFLFCFSIPFIFAGGLVIWIGGHRLVGSILGVQRTHPLFVQRTHPPFGSTRGVQVTNRSQDIEDGMEDSWASNDETSPYASSAYPSMKDLINAAGNDGQDLAGAVEAPLVSPSQTEDGADAESSGFWENLPAADDEG